MRSFFQHSLGASPTCSSHPRDRTLCLSRSRRVRIARLRPQLGVGARSPELKYCVPVFQAGRPAQNQPAVAMASRLPGKLMRSGRVPAAQNRIRSCTKSSFCSSRFSGCKAVALGALQRVRGMDENEIGRRGGLRAILLTYMYYEVCLLDRLLRRCKRGSDYTDITPRSGR